MSDEGTTEDKDYLVPEDFRKFMVKETGTAYDVSGEKFTFEEVANWDLGSVRYELYDGVLIKMEAPSIRHQELCDELSYLFKNYLKGKKCKSFSAVNVRLNHETSDDTYFIPDLVIVCDQSKIDKRSINGAPDLVIEVLSPTTRRYDVIEKRHKYEQAGVKEYWLVNQEDGVVEVALLSKDGLYRSRTYSNNENIKVRILEDLVINFADILEDLWSD